jgi:hypothetical protein
VVPAADPRAGGAGAQAQAFGAVERIPDDSCARPRRRFSTSPSAGHRRRGAGGRTGTRAGSGRSTSGWTPARPNSGRTRPTALDLRGGGRGASGSRQRSWSWGQGPSDRRGIGSTTAAYAALALRGWVRR